MAYFFHILRIMFKRANCSEKGDFVFIKVWRPKSMLVKYNFNYELD